MNIESLQLIRSTSGVAILDITTKRSPFVVTPSPVSGILLYTPSWINGGYEPGDVYEVWMRLVLSSVSDFTLRQSGVPAGGPGSSQVGALINLGNVPLAMYDIKMRYTQIGFTGDWSNQVDAENYVGEETPNTPSYAGEVTGITVYSPEVI